MGGAAASAVNGPLAEADPNNDLTARHVLEKPGNVRLRAADHLPFGSAAADPSPILAKALGLERAHGANLHPEQVRAFCFDWHVNLFREAPVPLGRAASQAEMKTAYRHFADRMGSLADNLAEPDAAIPEAFVAAWNDVSSRWFSDVHEAAQRSPVISTADARYFEHYGEPSNPLWCTECGKLPGDLPHGTTYRKGVSFYCGACLPPKPSEGPCDGSP